MRNFLLLFMLLLFPHYTFAITEAEINKVISLTEERCMAGGVRLANEKNIPIIGLYSSECNGYTIELLIAKYEDLNFSNNSNHISKGRTNYGIKFQDILAHKNPSIYSEEIRHIDYSSDEVIKVIGDGEQKKLEVYLKEKNISYHVLTDEKLKRSPNGLIFYGATYSYVIEYKKSKESEKDQLYKEAKKTFNYILSNILKVKLNSLTLYEEP